MYNTYIQSTEYNLTRQAGGPPHNISAEPRKGSYILPSPDTYIHRIYSTGTKGREECSRGHGSMAGGNQGFV